MLPTTRWLAALPLALVLTSCGSDKDYSNDPRPPAPINITASISNDRVSVSPKDFGAGPIVVIVTNQSATAQTVTLAGTAGGLQQSTAPIAPRDTATLKVDVAQGAYELKAQDATIKPATITVGAERESAQNDLLQP